MQNVWIWVVVIVIIVGGGLWWWSAQSAPTSGTPAATTLSDDGTPAATDAIDDQNTATTTTTTATTSNSSASATINYDGNSFTPSTVTIKKGGTVTWKGTANMWVASASHPSHTLYDGTSRTQHCAAGYTGAKPFDQCATGTSYSFTFTKTGTWSYHDHMNASSFGKVVVTD